MKKRKLLSVLLATVMMMTALTGCSGKSNSDSAGTTPAAETTPAVSENTSEEEVTLKLALWDYDAEGSVYPAILEAFNAKYPNIKVEVINASAADYETKITTMLASGDDVDVYFAKSNTSFPTLVQKGYALDLDSLIEEKGFDVSAYGTVLSQHYSIDDTLYALPFRTNDWVIYYNKNIFDEAGVTYPDNDMTWEEFFEIGKQLSGDDVYGAAFFPKPGFIVPCIVGSVDGFDINTSDFTELIPATQKVVDAMKDGSWEDYSESVSMSKDQTYFYQGKWGMLYNGSWFTQMLEAQDLSFEYGVVKSPYWEGTDKKGFATSTPVLINPKTKKLDAAWELLSFLCGEEGAKIVAQSMLVPGYQSEDIMQIFKDSTGIDETSMEALTNNTTYGLGEASVGLGAVSNVINEELELVLTGNQTVEQMAENCNTRREEALASVSQ